MCTLAWLPGNDGYILWHSRDERRARGVALPPVVEYGQGTGWISPRDTDAGGTWVGVNTHGVTVGIANLVRDAAPVPAGRKVSRGLLVRELLQAPAARQVEQRVRATSLDSFEPFTLVSLETGQPPVILRWDRSTLAAVPPLAKTLLVTSAGGNVAIERGRVALFESLGPADRDPDRIEALYRAPPDGSNEAICVHRAEVSTVSLVRIEVTPPRVFLAYTPGQPCLTRPGPSIMLDRNHVPITAS